MRETDREHRLIEHALSLMDLLRRNRMDLEQFVAGAIQPELPLEPQEERLAREAIALIRSTLVSRATISRSSGWTHTAV